MAKKKLYEQIKDLAIAVGTELAKKADKGEAGAGGGVISGSALGFSAIPSIPEATQESITFPQNSHIVLADGTEYVLEEDTEVDLSAVSKESRKGKDCYVWAGTSGEEIKLVAAFDAASNESVDNGIVIGGFHCLCADVGTIADHPLTGWTAGDILPNSVWTVSHRPLSDPEGMVWCPEIRKWVDIYLASFNGEKLVSVYEGTIADGVSDTKFNGLKFNEYAGLANKKLISYDEFIVVAKGSNECTAISTAADPQTTGGHSDSSRRMISNYGVEDCCGAMAQFCRNLFEFYPGASKSSYSLGGYSWEQTSTYNSTIDSGDTGDCFGVLRQGAVGGNWSQSTNCGSRNMDCHFYASYGDEKTGARLVSDPM